MNYYDRAVALKDELIANRRFIHERAETGLCTPKTRAFVMEKLGEYGIEASYCGESGVSAVIGGGEGRVVLLRADMDALPMAEETGLSFACPSGNSMHACGHDLHTAMLLAAAKLLKEDEAALKGRVKLMFQPGEETFQGSRDMIENGILDSPAPDAAIAYHVGPGRMPVGMYMYNSTGRSMMHSQDGFTVRVCGKGGHGAYPHTSVSPINIGVHIYLAFQELIARESDPSSSCVLTLGEFHAGSAPNIIPDTAVLKGTVRSDDRKARELLLARIGQVAAEVARVYRGTADVEFTPGVPPLICDPDLTKEVISYMEELPIPGLAGYPDITASASDDFALIAELIPSSYMYLSAGFLDERGEAPAHNSKVLFNEDVLPIGAACLAHCASRWLMSHLTCQS